MMNSNRKCLRPVCVTLTLFSLLFTVSDRVRAQGAGDQKLDAAIAALRNINQDKLNQAQKEAKAKEIDKAWETIRTSGRAGISRLKQEIQHLNETKQKDDFFKLNASSLLWQIGRFDEAESIAAIWESTPLDAQYNYVFYTAFEAALTHDPRVLPMLRACLCDKKGKVFVAVHSLDVAWPLNLEFLWGSFGAKGLPVLASVLDASKDSAELQSAMVLLAEAQYLDALPAIRRLAANSDSEVSGVAIRTLGMYGHPQDYEFLITGLRSKDPVGQIHFVYALYEYEDLRAVPLLVPLLKTENEALRQEVIGALIHLASVQSFDGLEEYCSSLRSTQEKQTCASKVARALADIPISLETYPKLSARAKETLVFSIRKSAEEDFTLQDSDAKLTRQQFLEVTSDWQKNHRIKSEKFDWVEAKHLLSVATDRDMDRLIDLRAALYGRLSDECLYEVATLNKVIRRVSRSRYRKVVGLTERVEGL
jgi:HEAT repeat protein